MRVRLFGALVLAGTTLAVAQGTPPPTGSSTPTAAAPAPDDQIDQLIRVVALFRHGVRAPLTDLNDPKDPKKPRYSKSPWPSLADWGVAKWGDLTPQGTVLARALGRDYADVYKKTWTSGFKAYLWADNESRTQDTAGWLVKGLQDRGIAVNFSSQGGGIDPLFHPFTGRCGVPNPKDLHRISSNITANAPSWIASTYADPFQRLYDVLACPDNSPQCAQLAKVTQNSASYCTQALDCGSAPIVWGGQFSYANTASEAFLLEYANNMDAAKIGWGQLSQPPNYDTDKLLKMLPLHEFYFDQTQREPYLAKILASNLIREIRQALNQENGGCRRIPNGYQFAALVGHDTNIAGVGTLLGLSWQFTNAPVGTRGVPDNDPLPAGALLFELRGKAPSQFVRVTYAAQGVREMRDCRPSLSASCPAFRLPVRCDKYSTQPGACDIPLKTFNDLVAGAVGPEFLSGCRNGQQTCPNVPAQE